MGTETSRENVQYSRQYGYHEVVKGTILKQYELTSSQQQQSFKNLIKMYNSFDVPTILPIVDSEPIINQTKKIYGWRLRFKNLQYTLQQQIQGMIKNQFKYTEQQILKAIDCILSALMGFKLKKIIHGNLHCQNIFIDYDPQNINKRESPQKVQQKDENKKVYTLGIPLLLNNNQQQKLIKQKKYQQLYLAPLGLIELSEERSKIMNSQKNDVFSLGLVALRMATFVNIKELYDFQTFKIRQNSLQRKIFQCRQFYSTALCNLIELLTSISERSRPDFQEVYNYCACMSSFEGQLKNKSQQKQNKTFSQVSNYIPVKDQKSNSKFKIRINKLKVDQPQLLQRLFISKQSQQSWLKFKNRIINKNKTSHKLLNNNKE